MNPTNRIMERIAKLLAIADPSANASQGEIENALRMAQDLMVEHQISEAMARAASGRATTIEVGETTIPLGRERKDIDIFVSRVLKRVTGVQIVWLKTFAADGKKHASFCVMGTPAQRDYAGRLLVTLQMAMPAGYIQWLVDTLQKANSNSLRAFYDGCAEGFIAACEAGRQAATNRATEAGRNTYALAIVNETQAIKAYMAQRFPNLRYGPSMSFSHGAASAAGFAHGQRIDRGDSKVSGASPRLR